MKEERRMKWSEARQKQAMLTCLGKEDEAKERRTTKE